MINIVGLNKHQLKGFTRSEGFKKFYFAPISELREISHANNPRATDQDILLYLAYDNDELAGYVGILPDDVTLATGEKIHFGWLSTLFVSEKFRGMQVAPQLLFEVEKNYDKNLIVTEFTTSAQRLYRKIGMFQDLTVKKAVRYYFKSNLAELLPFKKEIFENNKPLLKKLDNLINTFIPYLSSGKNHLYKISKSIDPTLEKFISKQKKNPIGRSSAEFRWILDFPWISREKEQPAYLFSSFAKDYEMFWVSVYQNQEIVATMFCSVRNSHLKVLYYFGNVNLIPDLLPKIIRKYKVKMMTIYDDQLNSSINKNHSPKALYKRPLERKYMIHKDFKEKLGKDFDFKFTDGDGDFSFT
ncbi:GNAT family N-acetyltransferase [Epilithonimonas sp. UC225_85]|uniref:GNAT family N-acetyltransferase n=1 Tax=Epilithonimonas sp. UC225_85 TaxID=3350167 RepID=UPI0036D3D36D